MGIDLHWIDEDGSALEQVPDTRNALYRSLASADVSNTVCLRSIDPYGDTVFNQLQIPVLVKELKALRDQRGPQSGLQTFIDLAQRSVGEVHTYLKFHGD
ncbi:MAG: hypothetical protein ACYS9X_30295 [Planctomycetota bacterium]|jgi:hypothetical protein